MSGEAADTTDAGAQALTESEQWVEAHREELEREAASDAPHAWVAQRVLQSVEEGES